MSELPVFDRSVLDGLVEQVGDDRGFVVELVETFLTDARHQLDELEAAVRAGDAAGTVRPAHTVKSSSATLGAMALAELARQAEAAGRAGTPPPSGDDLRGALASASAELRAWMAGGETP